MLSNPQLQEWVDHVCPEVRFPEDITTWAWHTGCRDRRELALEVMRLHAMIPTCDRGPKACDVEIERLTEARDLAERQNSILHRQLTRLREAIEKVPHLWCGSFHQPVMGEHKLTRTAKDFCIRWGGRCVFEESGRSRDE